MKRIQVRVKFTIHLTTCFAQQGMADRIIRMRELLRSNVEKAGSQHSWKHITDQVVIYLILLWSSICTVHEGQFSTNGSICQYS